MTADFETMKSQKDCIFQYHAKLQQLNNKNFMYWDHSMITSFILNVHPNQNDPKVIDAITAGVKDFFSTGREFLYLTFEDITCVLNMFNIHVFK